MTVSEAFIENENANRRTPIELYYISRGSAVWAYTSGDAPITYDSLVYQPATIQRGTAKYNSDLKAAEMGVVFAKTDPALSVYLATSPVKLAEIKIMKIFRDQDPFEVNTIFRGQILSVSLKGISATARCIGLEYLLQSPLLQAVYQPECNHTLFDDKCGLNAIDFKVETVVTVDETGTILESIALSGVADDYWTYGYVEWENDERLITQHLASGQVKIMSPFIGLETGQTVAFYPGCDGNVYGCGGYFNNLTHFFGFPNIPVDNPAAWRNR